MDTQRIRAIQFLQRQAASLLLYQSVLQTHVGETFLAVLKTLHYPDQEGLNCLHAYGQWFHALASVQCSWQDYLLAQILKADNPFSRQAQRSELRDLPNTLVAAAQQDLRSLQSLYNCKATDVSQWVKEVSAVPVQPFSWQTTANSVQSANGLASFAAKLTQLNDWSEAITDLANHYRHQGVGLLANYRAFRWQNGQLIGIACPDPIQLDELVGYDTQKQTLLQNTDALLNGYRALHVLLYGGRGTGKSSLVKGLLQHFSDRSLRLIEVSKSDLRDLPAIADVLRDLPQSFIIFVDDLSFEDDDDAFKALKVVLEGSVTARPRNVAVYATSNRRHLIREFFGDRPRPSDADEIHTWDTLQEKLSFSDRFGLTLTFEPANQDTYLEIVRHLASLEQITLDPDQLKFRALQWATRHNGRSGRTARQFIDFLLGEQAVNDSSFLN